MEGQARSLPQATPRSPTERHEFREAAGDLRSFRFPELGDQLIDALSSGVLVLAELAEELATQLVEAADHLVDRANRGVVGVDCVSVTLSEGRNVLWIFEVLPLPNLQG
jgi:hypothetical protein